MFNRLAAILGFFIVAADEENASQHFNVDSVVNKNSMDNAAMTELCFLTEGGTFMFVVSGFLLALKQIGLLKIGLMLACRNRMS